MRAMRLVAYGAAVTAMAAVPIVIILSPHAGALWYLAVPAFCIAFLSITKATVHFDWNPLVEDVKRSLKFLAALAVFNVLSCLTIAYLLRGSLGRPGLDLGFVFPNVVEELYFRATLIPLLELLESRLFDSVNRQRVVGISALVFGLVHVEQVMRMGNPVAKGIAVSNMLVAAVIGIHLGNTYYRSRNLPSVVSMHWWINLLNRILEMFTYGRFA